ncbi:MAG: N-acetyltransferase [Betaproteobacteria bacterium]|nr:N-acetyltransferase [Betaproteobacteria bacterium]
MAPRIRVAGSLGGIDAGAWDAFAGGNPFVRHAWLSALLDTGCASARTGWQPQFLVLERDDSEQETTASLPRLAGALPLFVKSHSRGEYVFDWAWADAYQRHGLEYYPKLLGAVPFTPVTGPRILAACAEDRALLIAAALEAAKEFSSLHVLFPEARDADEMSAQGMLERRTVQFHWTNEGYGDFEEFLARMSHQRRKNIRQERRRVRDAGIGFRTLRGAEITPRDWEFFNRCYASTYAAHRSRPYLNLEFFLRIGEALPEHMVMFVAERGGEPIAASFCVATGDALYGRYWGSVEYVPLLHFEACYYQPIEYCIAQRIAAFEGGAQGEHKLFRGLLPVETRSAHWLAHPQFARAIEDYLERETAGIARYVNELNEHSPFKDETP